MFILFAERKVGEQHGPAAQGVLAAVQTLREMNADNLRKVPADAPTAFMNHGSLAAANRGVAEYELSE
ncbi:hypothetical protein RK43_RS20815 [Escherichia coli]|nr:hypothetical protein [Escherichia coli]